MTVLAQSVHFRTQAFKYNTTVNAGLARLSNWLARNAEGLGRRYVSEPRRN